MNFFKNDQKENPVNETLIKNFLDDRDQRLLSTYIDEGDNSIKFDYKIPDNYQTILLFYKTLTPNVEGSEEMKLGMWTIEGGIIRTIYSSITSFLYETELAVSKTELLKIFQLLKTNSNSRKMITRKNSLAISRI